LGEAGLPHGNNETTVTFSQKFFGICTEDTSSDPDYKGVWIYASDFVD
jgi:hypothetical protein